MSLKFKSKIHQNKDWNKIGRHWICCWINSLRAKSIKTRIETSFEILLVKTKGKFKSKIHQNKDWNEIAFVLSDVGVPFKSKIHQNKDWNICHLERLPSLFSV